MSFFMLKKIIRVLLKLKVISWKNIMIKIYYDREYEVIYKINEKEKRKIEKEKIKKSEIKFGSFYFVILKNLI